MFGESHPTHQARIYHQEHLDRRERIAQKAVPDAGINLRKKKTIPELPKKIIVAVKPRPILPDPPILPAPPKRDWLWIDKEVTSNPNLLPPNFFKYLQHIVAKSFRITVAELISHSRLREYVRPRHAFFYLCKSLAPQMSYPQMARRTGDRDHSTAINSVIKAKELMLLEQDFCQTVVEIEQKMRHHFFNSPEVQEQ